MENVAAVANAVGTKYSTSFNPEFLYESTAVTESYLENGTSQEPIFNETPVAKRGILIELEQREFLQQQTKARLQSAFDAITPVQQEIDIVEPELKFCYQFKEFIEKYCKNRSKNCLHFKFLKNIDICDDILKKWDTNKINQIISPRKTKLTTEEKNRIIEVKDLFYKNLSINFTTFLDISKNIFTTNQQQKYNNDFELISFFIHWNNQFSTSLLLKENFLLIYREYMLSIIMLQVLNIDPHIIFTFSEDRFEKFENAHLELSENFIEPSLSFIKQEDDTVLRNTSIFYEFIMYKFWDNIIIDGLEDCGTLVQDKNFINFFAKYIVSFIHEQKTTIDSIKETSATSAVADKQEKFKIAEDKLYIGDEFEFWAIKNQDISEKEFIEISELWIKELKKTLKEKNITEYKIEEFEYLLWGPAKYKITIGEWSYCLFYDINALEVTPQPYRIKDKFSIKQNTQQQQEYSIAKLYDDFIFDIANKLNLKGRSGHKHFDTRALNGNAEFIFRFVLYIQNRAWLPRAFDRMERIHLYLFIANKLEDINQPLIQEVIACINENLQSEKYISKIDYHDDLVSAAMIFYTIKNIEIANKYSPLALHHITQSEEIQADLMVAPTSTMELRFFNCPDNGENAMSLNELVIDIIQFVLDEQNQSKPMKLDCIDPSDYSKEQAIDEYKKMLNELGCDDEKKSKYLKLIPWLNFNYSTAQ